MPNDIPCDSSITSIPQVKNGVNKFVLIPNPTHQNIAILGMETIKFNTVNIYSVDGRLVQNALNVWGAQIANVQHLSKGIYLVELIDA